MRARKSKKRERSVSQIVFVQLMMRSTRNDRMLKKKLGHIRLNSRLLPITPDYVHNYVFRGDTRTYRLLEIYEIQEKN